MKLFNWSPTCHFYGHKPNGLITGFRNEDGSAITRCVRCDVPIVCPAWRASRPLMQTIELGHKAEDQAQLRASTSQR